jgi:hypothetical protein
MKEVMTGHTAAGHRAIQSGIKDVFPQGLSKNQIEAAIRQAYRYGKRSQSQGERVFVTGPYGKHTIEMWVNTKTKMIETAWPKF